MAEKRTPADTYHELMDIRPSLLNECPPTMREWIGRVQQQYGTEANRLTDLQTAFKPIKKKADSVDSLFWEILKLKNKLNGICIDVIETRDTMIQLLERFAVEE